MFPGLNLPPRPVITRWRTWIEAAIYYAKHFDEMNSFLSTLDSNDARCILKAKKAIDSLNLKIHQNQFLVHSYCNQKFRGTRCAFI